MFMFIHTGECYGEIGALLDLRAATELRAASSCQLVCLTKSNLRKVRHDAHQASSGGGNKRAAAR